MVEIELNPFGLGPFDTGYISAMKVIVDGEEVVLTPDEMGRVRIPSELATSFVLFGQRFKVTGA